MCVFKIHLGQGAELAVAALLFSNIDSQEEPHRELLNHISCSLCAQFSSVFVWLFALINTFYYAESRLQYCLHTLYTRLNQYEVVSIQHEWIEWKSIRRINTYRSEERIRQVQTVSAVCSRLSWFNFVKEWLKAPTVNMITTGLYKICTHILIRSINSECCVW